MVLPGMFVATALAGCVSCWSPVMPGWYLSLDLYFLGIPERGNLTSSSGGDGVSPKGGLRSPRRVHRMIPDKATNRRTIIIPGYVPALPVPAYWRVRGSGWEVK